MYSNKRRLEYDAENYYPQGKKPRTALYLADYTPVRTIEVGNIRDNISTEYLRGFFERAAGTVSNVSMLRKLDNNQMKRFAYITFLMPEDAKRSIRDIRLQDNYQFTINQAPSQPKVDPKAFKFEDMNDDCLLHIISYLNLIDTINLGKTSTRLQSVTDGVLEKQTHFSFDAHTGNSLENELNLPIVLEKAGNYIQSLTWCGINSDSLAYLNMYCPNIIKLKLKDFSIELQSHDIKECKQLFAKLKILKICGANLFDVTLKSILSFSTQLKSLRLEKCPNLRGLFFYKNKNPELKYVKIIDCPKVVCDMFEFQRNNQLIIFSFDYHYSFLHCLISPPESLEKLTELQLDFSTFEDCQVLYLHFKGLKRLKKLILTRKSTREAYNCNNIITAMKEVTTLETLSIQKILIDDETFKRLAMLKNLKELQLKHVKNSIKKKLYTSLSAHLPKLTALSLRLEHEEEAFDKIELKWIRDMVSSLNFLQYFSHSLMNWDLLNMIQQIQLRRQQSVMKVVVPCHIFYDPRKESFMSTSNGAIQLDIR